MYNYYFRGRNILAYNTKTNELILPVDETTGIKEFDMCYFINEDYKLLAEYFQKIYKYRQGIPVDFEDIEVD